MANSILPLSSGSSRQDGHSFAFQKSGGGLPTMLRRLTKFRTMDFELAFWQLTYLVVAPRRVYKQTYHHKQTKNVWARDDPAMIVLISSSLVVAGLAWSLVYRESMAGTIYTILRMIMRDFILASVIIASLLHFLANRLLVSSASSPAIDNRVEWAYAFDVAVNSFFPLFLTLYGALLPLAPVVVKSNFVCLFIGNTLFLVAGIQYTYVTYLGYAALPFVARSELFLAPLLPIFGGYLLSLLGVNIARLTLELYFGKPWV
ncbi:UNC-50 protein [Kockovaella imperatae]|uniref:UNC-50 protein n=1 Tax=Kockovaella imperatae TaxID=4999 RepID=A0A1Y1U789_9TREE|nr:UNC-50 protein [Kockovaella imperatae]ORX33891.1 UNC-50 protein [Kockovaella imperatae]